MDREEHEKRLEELKVTIKENDGRLQNLQSTAFQLANYYFVFQGVILTAICNGATSLRCSDRWFLFTVSFLATILNLVALCIKGLKYLRTKTQQDKNWCECNELEKICTQLNRDSINAPPRTTLTHCEDSCKDNKRLLCFIACMILFLGFAGVTLYGCWHILCRKHKFDKRPGNDKCIKLCQGSRCMWFCSEF